MFWTGGLTNPLDVIEQITYLMFIRDLDEMDNTRKKDSLMLGLSYQSMFVDKEHLINSGILNSVCMRTKFKNQIPSACGRNWEG